MSESAQDDISTTLRLVRASKQGDTRALDDLMRRYLPVVRQIVALRSGRKLKQWTDDEDVVQEVLLKVLSGLQRFEERSEGRFRNWVARCVECEIVDQQRAARAQKRGGGNVRRFGDCTSTLVGIFRADAASPSEVASADELAELIEDKLLSMEKRHRELIILRSICGMSYAEIAAEMGFAQEVTGRMACSRALQRLKELVGV